MDILNSDGSRAGMCGNGLRCFVLYALDEGLVYKFSQHIDVETMAGRMGVEMVSSVPGLFSVKIDMGAPDFSCTALGVKDAAACDMFLSKTLDVGGLTLDVSSVYTGTVHTVIWINEDILPPQDGGDITAASLYEDPRVKAIGRAIESSSIFLDRTNVDFAYIKGRGDVEMITYERGAGLTPACGTGACAVAAVGMLEDRLDSAVRVHLPYGELEISRGEDGHLFMQGTAEKVFEGETSVV
jgi:diaminopimelate epimerase